jgi:hypothetical protein
MTVTVDPAQLDGYAAQLERNSDWFISPLRDHCGTYCARTDGMTGLLYAAQPIVRIAMEGTTGLFTSAERNLSRVASNLRAAAAGYRAGDTAAAERVWSSLPGRGAPDGYVDRSDSAHRADFCDPFAVRPPAPAEHGELTRYIEEARHHTGVIDEFLRRYLNFSLAEHVLPAISGDWDTLCENAEAYAALAGPAGVQAIRANLAYGMDSLSASWDSPAATQFAFQIRERWLPALDALQHVLQMHEECFEAIAQQAENTFQTLVLLIEVLKFWVIEKVLRIVKIAGAVLGGGRVWDEIMELFTGLLKVWHQIKLLFEELRLILENLRESIEAVLAAARVIEDMWLAPGENRLDPLRVGAAR